MLKKSAVLMATAATAVALTSAWYRAHPEIVHDLLPMTKAVPAQLAGLIPPATETFRALNLVQPTSRPVIAEAPAPATQPAPMQTVDVRRGAIVQSFSCTGTVAANLELQIKCSASGVVMQLGPRGASNPIDVGDFLHKGDLLAMINDSDAARSQRQAEAQLAMSQVRLEQAKQNVTVAQEQLSQARETANGTLASAQAQYTDAQAKAHRRQELLAQNLDTQEDYDTAAANAVEALTNLGNAKVGVEQLKTQEEMIEIKQQDVQLAQTQIQADQINLEGARQALADCTITAPVDGVVTKLYAQPGTMISAGSPLVDVADMSHLFVLASVNQDEIGNVEVGQDVEITANADPKNCFCGKVVRVAAEGVSESGGVTFQVKTEVLGCVSKRLKPQMTATVRIIESRKADALLVPAVAVLKDDGADFVRVMTGQRSMRKVPVQLGLSDGSNAEVVGGLHLGDKVVMR